MPNRMPSGKISMGVVVIAALLALTFFVIRPMRARASDDALDTGSGSEV